MKNIINLYKPAGITPLQAINIFREKNGHYKTKKMSYAGRLDPLAEGVLLVLVGDETKRIGSYLGFDKEYKAEILIGISTDSNDVLGIASKKPEIKEIDIKVLKKKIKELKGSYNQKIPDYSSYKIKGRPMFYYARKGEKVADVKKSVRIKSIKINSIYNITSNKLVKDNLTKIDKVKGDFRQEEIKERWKELLKDNEKFLVVDLTIQCSSGTYIRAIADEIGKDFGGGLLLSLKRTMVGKFDIKDSLLI